MKTSLVHLVGEIISRTKKETRYAGTLTPLGETPGFSGTHHFRIQHVDPVFIRASRSPNSAELLVAENHRKKLFDNALPYWAWEERDSHQTRRARRQHRTDNALYSSLVYPHGQDSLTKKVQGFRTCDGETLTPKTRPAKRANDSKPKGDHHVFTRTDFEHFCAFFGMRVFLHFDCAPLCCVFFKRSKGGQAPPFA